MNLGKQVRLQRIFNRETGRAIIVPMDHGVSVGPIEGIENIHKTVSDMADGGADAVLMHKGLCRCCFRASGEGKDVGLIIHLSASTSLSSYSNKKRLVCTVEEAIRRGADGVSVHVNLGDDNESDMLADLGEVARVAEEWSMPLLAMLYARGPRISNEYDPAVVAHCARVGVELGADIVKVPYTGDIDSFADVIAGCCVPVVIAGGPRTETTREFLEMVDNSLKAGGSGLSVGRNVFQHPKRVQLVRALRGLVHQGLSLDEALASLKNIVSELKLSQGTLTLDKATITEVKTVGLGHRVCVDTLTLMERGQGMLVGNSSAFTFLTHAETEHNEYVAARPFRINAGGVHAYAVMPGDKTCYVGELRSGDEVLIVDKDGRTSLATIGRIKTEVRPMLMITAQMETPEGTRTGSVFLQNAETIRLVRPDGTPVSVVALRPGDEVICRADVAGRHFGMRIQENIREI